MDVIVTEVTTKSDRKAFVTFPNRLYQGNPYFVPQLMASELASLDPKQNHAFVYCEAKYWLARNEEGDIVGRIAGIINHSYNEKSGLPHARFSYCDFIEDLSVARALFDTVAAWAKSKNLTHLNGPIGFHDFDACGFLVDGFDELPTAYGKYNFPYYDQFMKELGFAKSVDWVEYRITIPETMPEVFPRLAEMVGRKEHLRVGNFKSKKELRPYFDKIFALMNRAYANLHGFSELSEGQIQDLIGQFVPLLDLRLVAIVLNDHDDVVGFGICLPSLSKAFQKAKGHLFPFGIFHIQKALRKNDVLDTLLISIDEDYQNKGVNALIFNYIYKGIKEFGMKYIESTRQLEDNHHVLNLWNKFKSRQHKRARSYIKKID